MLNRVAIYLLGSMLFGYAAMAQIAPECVGVAKPVGFNSDQQQVYIQNYFAASMIMTPVGPIVPYNDKKAGIGVEVGFIPALTCQQRLVQVGTILKTENTNLTPVLPRPRLTIRLPDTGPILWMAGLSVMPPIPFPMGTILQAGGEIAAGWRSHFGLGLGIRGHLNMTQVRAEFATPLVLGAPAVDDLFITSSFGADVGVSYALPWSSVKWLMPFASMGYAGTRMLSYIGDDAVLVQNPNHSWSGFLLAAGLQALLLGEHLEIGLEVSSAVPVFTTIKGRIGYVW